MLLCNCLLLVQKRSDGARVYEGLWLRASDASYSLWMIESGERDNPGYRATCVKGDDSATKLKGPDAIPMYQQRTLNDGLLWDPFTWRRGQGRGVRRSGTALQALNTSDYETIAVRGVSLHGAVVEHGEGSS